MHTTYSNASLFYKYKYNLCIEDMHLELDITKTFFGIVIHEDSININLDSIKKIEKIKDKCPLLLLCCVSLAFVLIILSLIFNKYMLLLLSFVIILFSWIIVYMHEFLVDILIHVDGYVYDMQILDEDADELIHLYIYRDFHVGIDDVIDILVQI